MSKEKLPTNYPNFLAEVKARIRSSQYAALRRVNAELIQLYWELGKMIVERQKQDGWGAFVVDRLADDLQSEFAGQSGFSRRNLYRIRDFYLAYQDGENVPPLVAQIGWSHNAMILEKCKRPEERLFYLTMTKKFGWTKNVLAAQIESQAFARAAMAHSNFDKVLPAERASQAQLSIKDEYTFEFLELEPEHSERELERALLAKVNLFLSEMGGMFTLVGSQYRLRVDEEDFFIDLLLYHRALKCFVAIELKVTDFKPAYAGQMQFYLAALNATHRLPDEGPAIGIILCRDKKRTIVEYALANSTHPIGVASYVVSKVLPKNLKGKLPTEEQISKLLEAVSDNHIEVMPESATAYESKARTPRSKFVPPVVARIKARRPKQAKSLSKPQKKKTTQRKSKK
jgi:predicted nuclease of restriction endonuclease-like (RecB) superfamily